MKIGSKSFIVKIGKRSCSIFLNRCMTFTFLCKEKRSENYGIAVWFYSGTRMHSSRMRTIRSSGRLSWHCHPPAMHAPLPCMPDAMHSPFQPRLFAMHALPATYAPCHPCPPAMHAPRGQNSWHTLLKILSCANFVPGGKYAFMVYCLWIVILRTQLSELSVPS